MISRRNLRKEILALKKIYKYKSRSDKQGNHIKNKEI
jgi:hypothetical protein